MRLKMYSLYLSVWQYLKFQQKQSTHQGYGGAKTADNSNNSVISYIQNNQCISILVVSMELIMRQNWTKNEFVAKSA